MRPASIRVGGGSKVGGASRPTASTLSRGVFFSHKTFRIQVCEAVNSIRRIASNSPVFVADRERISAGAQKYCGHSANVRWTTIDFEMIFFQAASVKSGSCPGPWCRSGYPEQRWLLDQAATVGRVTRGASLRGG